LVAVALAKMSAQDIAGYAEQVRPKPGIVGPPLAGLQCGLECALKQVVEATIHLARHEPMNRVEVALK
jgi:hypothetical protein